MDMQHLVKCYVISMMLLCTSPNPIEITQMSDSSSVHKNDLKTGLIRNATMEYETRLENIKRDILDKLGLEKAPTETYPRKNIPAVVLSGLMSDSEFMEERSHEDERIKRKVVIVGNLEATAHCPRRRCMKVRFQDKTSYDQIVSTQLWFHLEPKRSGRTITSHIHIYQMDQQVTNQKHRVSSSRMRNTKGGWYAVQLNSDKFRLKQRQTGDSDIDILLDIECDNCHFSATEQHVPLLITSTLTTVKYRNRRSDEENCSPLKSCCRVSFVVDFKQIGWDNWVKAPASYDAHFCKGTCVNDQNFEYQHTSIVQAVAEKTKRSDIKLCCSPSKYMPLMMLYYHDRNLIRRTVENMIVGDCWCS